MTTMTTSDNGRKFIEEFEGLVLVAADDGFGNPTVGYGHTTAAGPPHVTNGMKITKEQADEYLARDLHNVEYDVNTWVVVPLNQDQFDALVSFQFNTGGLRHSTLLRLLNNRNYSGAADQFTVWNHANGKVVPGLTRRRAAERAMFLSSAGPVPTQPRVIVPTPTPQVNILTTIINFLKGLFNVNNSSR